MRAQNKEMTMALYDGGARFFNFNGYTLEKIFESDDENIKKFTINILEEIMLFSREFLPSSDEISREAIDVVKDVLRALNCNLISSQYLTAWEFCFHNFYRSKNFIDYNLRTLINVFSDIYDNLGNRKGMIPEVLDLMVFLTFKHFRNMQDSINDENFIKTLDFRKVESLYKAIFKIGEGKFHFTFDSTAKILKQISDEPAFREKGEELVNLLCCCTKFENLNLEVISDLLAHLSGEKNIGSVTSIIKHLGLENVDCAKILMRMIEPLDGKANKLLQDGIIGFYVFISALGKNHSDLMNGLEYEKGIRESVKRKGKLIFSGNRTLFSETDLMSAIVDKKITVIEEAVKNKKLEHSLFILNLEGVNEFVRKMCECCKAPSKKPSKKIQDALSYTTQNLITEIETKDSNSKSEAKEIYKNAFKLAIETGFYDAAKLLAPSCDNAAEFLHILEEYPEHTANMLKKCEFKFGKKDLLLYLLSNKSFDNNALSDAKLIVESGYNITDLTIRAVENKCTKTPENNDILEFSQFIKQYFAEHHDIEPQNPHADIIGEETKGGDETPS